MPKAAAAKLIADLKLLHENAHTEQVETDNVDFPPGGVTIKIPAWFTTECERIEGKRKPRATVYNLFKNIASHLVRNPVYQPPTPSRWTPRFIAGEDNKATTLLRHKSEMWLYQDKSTRKLVYQLCHSLFFHNGTANRNAQMQIVTPLCPLCSKELDCMSHSSLFSRRGDLNVILSDPDMNLFSADLEVITILRS